MKDLMKSWKVILMFSLLALSIALIAFNGLRLGIDFNGGTLFEVHLERAASTEQEMVDVTSTISQRLDWTGLKDTKVSSFGNEFALIEIAETNPEQVALLESLIKKQGKFEAMIDSNVMFTGAEIISIIKDPAKGYGLRGTEKNISWVLPFALSNEASQRFKELTFHKCTLLSYNPETGSDYECEKTFFFIDRPLTSVLVMPDYLFEEEKQMPVDPRRQSSNTISAEELLKNASVPFIIFDKNLSGEQLIELKELSENHFTAIILPETTESIKESLKAMNFKLKEFKKADDEPWLWTATGLKSIIFLTESVANMKAKTLSEAESFPELIITGGANDAKDAKERLQQLTIILESGSLPIAVESVSRESISPALGKEFFFYASITGLLALIVVALVLFIRYRFLKLVIPIMFTAIAEVILVLGLASLINWSLDLAAVAGIIAAVGTGVNDQIVIIDELSHKRKEEVTGSLVQRGKRAFFIVIAAASTLVAALAPLIFFGFGLGKLVGFAITTIAGVFVGVLITRPAFNEIAQKIIEK